MFIMFSPLSPTPGAIKESAWLLLNMQKAMAEAEAGNARRRYNAAERTLRASGRARMFVFVIVES